MRSVSNRGGFTFAAFSAADEGRGGRGRDTAYSQSVSAFGFVLVALIGACAAILIYVDQHVHRSRAERDVVNLVRIAERSALGVVQGVDRQLRFLGWGEREQRDRTDWPRLLASRALLDEDSVEIAVVDASGLMIASTLDTLPQKLVDLSDKPHFLAQRDSRVDELYIGPVVIGRERGRSLVQFSRKRSDEDGRFAGIYAYSLAAEHFDREFADLNVPVGGGLALVGDDGAVMAGSGVFADNVGHAYDEASLPPRGFDASSRIGDYPITAVSHFPAIEADAGWRMRRMLVISGAIAATLLTLLATVRVVRRRRRVEQELLSLSRLDALTGLANRRSFSQALDALCQSQSDDFALHVLDLDRFKAVNDTYGHPVGDEILRMAALRLAKLVGPNDMVARLGGDEFAILQRVSHFETEAPALARKVNRVMAQPFPTVRVSLSIGATVGVARGRVDGRSAVELMQAADLALYAAKSAGRGGARVFRREMTEAAVTRVKLEEGLRRALDAREFHLVYQPIHSLKRETIVGYEALLRWRPDGGDIVPSGLFIPVAEDIGLIVEIGDWVLRQACADIAALPGDLEVSVNVSPVQLEAGVFVASVRQALKDTGLPPYRLRIEITESALMADKPIVADQVRALRDLGVGVSLDDFGTGYSCLSYLELYPIDTLKIDQRFIAKLGTRPEAVATLRAIVDLARSFGMKTVAEGVETPEQLQALRGLGCARAQGYLLGRPGALPARAQSRAA